MFLINNEFFLTLKISNEKNDLFLNVNIEGFNFSQPFKVKWDLPSNLIPGDSGAIQPGKGGVLVKSGTERMSESRMS